MALKPSTCHNVLLPWPLRAIFARSIYELTYGRYMHTRDSHEHLDRKTAYLTVTKHGRWSILAATTDATKCGVQTISSTTAAAAKLQKYLLKLSIKMSMIFAVVRRRRRIPGDPAVRLTHTWLIPLTRRVSGYNSYGSHGVGSPPVSKAMWSNAFDKIKLK